MSTFPPGPELDLLVANALGLVPCEARTTANAGSAWGGPACLHTFGACYGSVPPFSQDGHEQDNPSRLSLLDLPPNTWLARREDGTWSVRLEGGTLHGVSEAHVLSLAVLASHQIGILSVRFTVISRWNPLWEHYVRKYGLTDAAWTPERILLFSRVLIDDGRFGDSDFRKCFRKWGDPAPMIAYLLDVGVPETDILRAREQALSHAPR